MHKPKKAVQIFLSAMVFFLAFRANSQSHDVDSLKQVIAGKVHDTTKLKAIAYLLVNIPTNSQTHDHYNEQFKSIATRVIKSGPDPIVREKGYDALAAYYNNKAYKTMQSDYLLTIKNLNISLSYFDPKYFISDRYKDGRAFVLTSLGVMYNKIGNTKQAIDNYFQALRIFESMNRPDAMAYSYQSIANLYFDQKKFSDALKYYLKAYDIFYRNDNLSYQDNIQKTLLFISIGKCHREVGECALSESYLKKGLAIATVLGDRDLLSELHFNIGRNEENCSRDYGKALSEYKISLSQSGLPENNANSLVAIGSIELRQQNYAEAEKHLKSGLDFARQISHLELQRQALEKLTALYKETKRFEKALETRELYGAVKDSIKKEQNDNALTKKQLQYEYDTKQAQLRLEQERKLNTVRLENQENAALKNNLLIGLSGVLLLLAAVGYFQHRSNKQKQSIAGLEKKQLSQKLLLSQMNPHFIFNSIDNIQSLIYNKQDKQAVDYLTKFSKLTRQILENSNENYISLAEELTMIDNYLSIQQLLHNNKFDFEVRVDESIDANAILLPPMLTQPFIENAIKHGLKNAEGKGRIDVSFKLENDRLFFEVVDNGAGFVHNEPINHKSMAMKITRERLANISGKDDFEVKIENRSDVGKTVSGTRVFFEIPYIYEN